MSKAISLTGLSEFLKKCKEIFAEKEEKYIIIDWGGKDSSDATKKAEVDAILKNLYLANPLSLFSVIFKNRAVDPDTVVAKLERFVTFREETNEAVYAFYLDSEDGSGYSYSFSIAD